MAQTHRVVRNHAGDARTRRADKVLDIAFDERPHNKKEGRSASMARWAVQTNTTQVAEGVNNASRALVPERVYVTLNEYSEIFSWTSQAGTWTHWITPRARPKLGTIW